MAVDIFTPFSGGGCDAITAGIISRAGYLVVTVEALGVIYHPKQARHGLAS